MARPVLGHSTGFPFYLDAARSNFRGYDTIHKFGAAAVGTSIVPVTNSLVYQTPTTAQALEFVSSSANDTAAGTGAREITVIGLDANWSIVTQTLATNGTTAVALSTNLVRLYRWFVSGSGTYATSVAGSHVGTLTIRAAGAGATWTTIATSPFPMGRSEIGSYTVAMGQTGYLLSQHIIVDSNKAADVIFFSRSNADTVAAPFAAMNIMNRFIGITGEASFIQVSPGEALVGPCDVGFMANVSVGSGDISVDFELLLTTP